MIMVAISKIDDSNITILSSTPSSRYSVIFGILTAIIIPSILCYLFIFIQFSRKPRLCRSIHSHSVLIILTFSFLQVISEEPLILAYLHIGTSIVQSDNFCKFWSTQDFVFGGIILMLMCFSSVERYLLIFHRRFIFRHLIILHYLPLIICIIYPFIFYVGMIYIYPCVNYFDYTVNTCGGPCYVFDEVPSIFDLLFNLAFFETMGVLANVILVSRVLYQKHRMKQQNKWRKNRRLLIQVLSITLLHNVMLVLMVSCMLAQLFLPNPPPILADLTFNSFQYGVYLVHLLCPFASLVGLPKLRSHSIPLVLRRLLLGNIVQPSIQMSTHINIRVPQHQPTRATNNKDLQ